MPVLLGPAADDRDIRPTTAPAVDSETAKKLNGDV
jgi:hypothetical protein